MNDQIAHNVRRKWSRNISKLYYGDDAVIVILFGSRRGICDESIYTRGYVGKVFVMHRSSSSFSVAVFDGEYLRFITSNTLVYTDLIFTPDGRLFLIPMREDNNLRLFRVHGLMLQSSN